MSRRELFERIEWDDKYQISPTRILNREIKDIRGGLQVLTICNDGSGRSRTVASKLQAEGIGAYSLEGGLSRIHNDSKIARVQNFLAGILNEEVQYTAVILTIDEVNYYLNFLRQLKRYQYSNSMEAIESLIRLVKEE